MTYNGSLTNNYRANVDPMTDLIPHATYESLKEKEEASSQVRVAFAFIQWCHFNNSQVRGGGGKGAKGVVRGVKSSHANQHRNITNDTVIIMILTIQALVMSLSYIVNSHNNDIIMVACSPGQGVVGGGNCSCPLSY